jgi:hypothetical protein
MADEREYRISSAWNNAGIVSGVAQARSQLAGLAQAAQQYSVTLGQYGEPVYRLVDSTQKVGSAAAISGEKMAKYGTLAAKATGSLQAMGVSSEVLAAGIGVASEAMQGLASTATLIAGGIGIAAAAIGLLVTGQRELKKATEEASAALARQARERGEPIVKDSVRAGIERQIAELESERDAMGPIKGVPKKLLAVKMGLSSVTGGSSWGLGNDIANGAVVAAAKVEELNKRIKELREGLNVRAGATDAWSELDRTGPDWNPNRPGRGGAGSSSQVRADWSGQWWQGPEQAPSWTRNQLPLGEGIGVTASPAMEQLSRDKDRAMQMANAMESLLGTAFSNIGKGWETTVKAMGTQFLSMIEQVVAKAIAMKVAESIFNVVLPGSGSLISGAGKSYGSAGAKSMNAGWRAARG